MNSLWSETVKMQQFPTLNGDVKTDVLIIGGGMAGILCAYFLQQAGVDYLLVERNRIGGGITKDTTAKITAQHGLLYHKLVKSVGVEQAKMYLEANQKAVEEFARLCSGMDCDFEEKEAFVYSLDNPRVLEQEMNALKQIGLRENGLQKFGLQIGFQDQIPLPFDIAGAIRFSNQAQFHPMKFLRAVSKDLHIRERTCVQELAPHTAITAYGTITAKHMIIASHVPFLNKHGMYFLKMYQHRSYAIALKDAGEVNGMYLEEKKKGLSFRNYGKYLIIGGGAHKTGKKGGNWQVLRDFVTEHFPKAKEVYHWATQDCMTLDGIPYIGSYGKHAEGLYVATGFNKWGMTSSMVSAQILTDMILGKKNEFAQVFSPQRSMMKPRLAVNGISAVGNLLTPALKRCPHLGCALKWNKVEQTWDCPCHGSRFERIGAVIDNPATGDLK